MRTLSESIAEWACELHLKDVPKEVVNQVKMAMVDTLSVAVRGALTPVAEVLRKTVVGLSTQTGANIIGDDEFAYPAEIAAQVNSSLAHALDFDDNSYAGFVHASAVIIPAAIAVAQETGASGKELLLAVVVGLESELLVGEMTRGLLYEKGWWTTGVLGVIGAAVASGRLLGLTKTKMTHALGLAVSGTGGIKACFGTDGKSLLAGMTSANAIRHVKLAKNGATGPYDVFESEKGFFNLFNDGVSEPLLNHQPGAYWKIIDPGLDIKEIPVCLSSHAAVEAVRSLKREFSFTAEQVESVVCDVPPIVIENLVYERPKSPQEAQFSLTFPVAVTLLHDRFLLKHLSLEEVMSPATVSLMSMVSMHTGDSWDADRTAKYPEGADVEVRLKDGKILRKFVGVPQSSKDKSHRWEMLKAKASDCLSEIVKDVDRDAFLHRLQEIESIERIGYIYPPMTHPLHAVERTG